MENKILKYNANDSILVRLKDKGIEHYVSNHNKILPSKYHVSCKEFREKANEQGYHSFQLHSFMDDFGGLGMRLSSYVDINFLINSRDLQEYDSEMEKPLPLKNR